MAVAEPAGQLPEMGVEPVVHHDDLAPPNKRLDPLAVPLRDLLERVAAVVEHVRPVPQLGPVPGIHVEQGQAFRLGHLPDQRVDRLVALGSHVGDDRHRDDGRPREVPAQPADQLGVVLGEVGLELLPLADVVQAVADEDVIDVSEGGDLLVVPAGRERPRMNSPSRPWLMTSAGGRSFSAASSSRITSSRWGPSGSTCRQTLPMVVLSPRRRILTFLASPPGRDRQAAGGRRGPGSQGVDAPHPTGSPGVWAAACSSQDH